jgi:membrane associated rhomboid family serine protease
MIPIRDTIRSQHKAVVNTTLIGINIFVFLIQLSQGPQLDRFIYYYGLVPARYTSPQLISYFSLGQQILSLFSFMFLHGGFWHILGNMWFLHIFGDNVEDRLGPLRYGFFYVVCGLASGLSHLFLNPHSNVPTIGASGAIAGVMGAYFLLYPRSKVLTLIPIVIIPWFVEIPAFFFLGFWFVMQFINAAGSNAQMGGIAWWAHVGGFIFGMIFLKLFQRLPATGVSDRMRRATANKTTHRLQVVRPAASGSDAHLYATLTISPYEALVGTRKLVNIPWGFQKRLLRVLVPPGINAGQILRLKGLGKITPDGDRGDLLLKVVVQ